MAKHMLAYTSCRFYLCLCAHWQGPAQAVGGGAQPACPSTLWTAVKKVEPRAAPAARRMPVPSAIPALTQLAGCQ